MKNYIRLLILVSVSFMVAFTTPKAVENSLPKVSTIYQSPGEYYPAITASGTVENTNEYTVSVNFPVIIEKFFKETGDKVKKGETLAKIDTAATLEYIKALTQYTQISSPASAGAASAAVLAAMQQGFDDELTSPISGIISSMSAKKTPVEPGKPIITIIRAVDLIARVSVDESEIIGIKKGQNVKISGVGFGGKTYNGIVHKIYPSAHKQYAGIAEETVVDVIIKFVNPDDSVRTGYTVTAEISAGESEQIYTLPYNVIRQDEAGEFVYVYNGNRAIKQYIETGIEFAECTQITKGLNENDEIIVMPDNIERVGFVKKIEP